MNTKKIENYIRWFETITVNDVPIVGGKNASLGEMIRSLKAQGIRVPDGFATTADAYRHFLETNKLTVVIRQYLRQWEEGELSLEQAGRAIRRHILHAGFPDDLAEPIQTAYHQLCQRYHTEHVDVAVRSSATAEDLPQASFAGQQETFLNITGDRELLDACRKCYASLFTDRAISYRKAQGFDHLRIALSIGVQKMVRSDKAGAGVMFTIDTETGFPAVIVINASWGLGENVVKGSVTPDEYMIFKPLVNTPDLTPIIQKTLGSKEKKLVYAVGGSEVTKNVDTTVEERRTLVLNDEELMHLARWACLIEKHYGRPMDIEWAKDGQTGELFIVQARPETVQSQREAASLKTYSLKQSAETLIPLLTGLSIGEAIATGKVCLIKDISEIDQFEDGAILVTGMTDPDWVPIMQRAAGIITDFGGRTCHAAIVSRELGVPAVVGTGAATQVLKDKQPVTLSCAEGDQGHIYDGILEYEEHLLKLEDVPKTSTRVMMNIGDPAAAMRWWRLPCAGIGLARMEFIISNIIKIHPMALIHFDQLKDRGARRDRNADQRLSRQD
ncbi:MAG: phosphoenolpyruvate synthase [Anaerolineae bacterium]